MWILRLLFFGCLIAMVVAALAFPETADKARILDYIGAGVFASFGLLLLGYLRRIFKPRRRAKPAAPTGKLIVVDGSNVMHWGGDPSVMILGKVLKELQNRGYAPLVYFDANAGYKLFDKHIDARGLAIELVLPEEQITMVPSGVTADEVLLERAVQDGLRVVSNDRFRDWKTKFPQVGKRGFLVKGVWKQGTVILPGLDSVQRVRAAE